MKTIITIYLFFLSITLLAQDEIYLHTTTVTNVTGDATFLDHPNLNNNANASIFVMHNYSPNETLHSAPIGIYYDGTSWLIYNEDLTNMDAGLHFNVFIADGAELMETTADGTSYSHIIDNPLVNNNSLAALFATKYYNPFGIRNTKNYGFWFDELNWNIYAEDINSHPTNASYKLLLRPGNGSDNFVHTATAANTTLNWTTIDHPLLNGNPNAKLIAQHNWGSDGDPANMTLDKAIGVWYTGANWAIYIEDQTLMQQDLAFNVYITDPSLAIGDYQIEATVSMHPNPARDHINITTKHEISEISVYNILGQKLIQLIAPVDNTDKIDISKLNTGAYVAKITTASGSQSLKFIKN